MDSRVGAYYSITGTDATGRDSRTIETGNNTSYQLDLNVFRSGIDPNFAVLSLEFYFIRN